MRTKAIILTLLLGLALAVGPIARAAVPDRTEEQVQLAPTAVLTGSQAELEAALREESSVAYKILVVDENPADRTAYLDEVLADWGWPAANEAFLVIFPQANYDIRFALGANFRASYLSVDEMLRLVRTEYLSRSRKDDASGALAALIRAVNRRMSHVGVNAYQERFDAMRRAIALIERQDVDGLLAMLHPDGLFALPPRVGLPETGLGPERARTTLSGLVQEAKPVIVAYNLSVDGQVTVAVKGLQAGLDLPAAGSEEARIKSTEMALITLKQVGRDWKLSGITVDTGGFMSDRIAADPAFQKPFAWYEVRQGESYSAGYGSLSGGQSNTTQQVTTRSLQEALAYLGEGANLPPSLDGKPMVVYRGFTVDYQPLTTSLMSLDPSFHGSYSPEGSHTGYIEFNADGWSVQVEHLTINGRPAMLVSADEKREGGWQNRSLFIEDGNWMYHLDDGLGNTERLMELAKTIPAN